MLTNVLRSKPTFKDRDNVVFILANSFANNKIVNYMVKQDGKVLKRINYLMSYSFNVCMMFGNVYLPDDKNGCASIIHPEKKRTNLKSLTLDLKLILKTRGFLNIRKAF